MVNFSENSSAEDSLKCSKEAERIAAVHKVQVLDSQYETFYNSINKLAALICEVPVAMLTMVDDENVWISSAVGAPGVTKIPRENAFCGWVVTNDQYLEVPDTSLDINHSCHPLVTDAPNFMFYAGTPLTLPMGEVIGALCVFDVKPNRMTMNQKTMLEGLADIVSKALVVKNHVVRLS